MALSPTKLITSVLTMGAFIAALATAAPAQAGDRDGAKLLFGTAATLLLLHELNKQTGSHDKPKIYAHQTGRQDGGRGHGYQREERRSHGYGHGNKHGHGHKAKRREALPRRCLRDTRRQGLVMGARCLDRNYGAAHRLPGVCETRTWVKGRERAAYSYGCLRKRGYTLARH